MGTTHNSNINEITSVPVTIATDKGDKDEKSAIISKNVTKIIVANSQAVATCACSTIPQKIVGSPLITVMSAPGPITVVKSSSLGSSTTSHFTLVNSTPLYVKTPTITLLNAPPITVVKALSGTPQPTDQPKGGDTGNAGLTNNGSLTAVTEKTLHNVFVKKPLPSEPDIPQGHKLLTANSFPASNVSFFLNT